MWDRLDTVKHTDLLVLILLYLGFAKDSKREERLRLATCNPVGHGHVDDVHSDGNDEVLEATVQETHEAIVPVLELDVGVDRRESVSAPFRVRTLPVALHSQDAVQDIGPPVANDQKRSEHDEDHDDRQEDRLESSKASIRLDQDGVAHEERDENREQNAC